MNHEHAGIDLVISYAAEDHAWVEGYLLDALNQAAMRCHLEAMPERRAARGQTTALFSHLFQQSNHTLIILSAHYPAATLTDMAATLAQHYGPDAAAWPVTLLSLATVELPPRLTMVPHLDATSTEQWHKSVERLCAALHYPLPDEEATAAPPCPYPGMAPFSEADSSRFFGRDQETHAILEHLRHHPLLTIIGPSGSGKSSLVFAGLLPALRRVNTRLLPSGSGAWLVRTLRPGPAPLAALSAALDGNNPDTPSRTVLALQAAYPGTRRLLLVIDQFEELFTLAPHDAVPFQQALLHLVETSQHEKTALQVFVVVILRADFYPALMESPLWSAAHEHRLELTPLRGEHLHEAITRPARDVGVAIEPALLRRLAEDAASEPGMLPFLQETLVLLWGRLQRRFLPLQAYAEALLERGIKGGAALAATPGTPNRQTALRLALVQHADAALKALTPPQQALARRIFLHLIHSSEGTAETCSQQSVVAVRAVSDEPLLFEQTLRHLIEQRLLTLIAEEEQGTTPSFVDPEGRADEQRGMRTRDFIESAPRTEAARTRKVAITHEVLLYGWPTLRHWLAEHRAALQLRQRLEEQAGQWVRLGRGERGLLTAAELARAEALLAESDPDGATASETLHALLHASREAQHESQPATSAASQAAAPTPKQQPAAAPTREPKPAHPAPATPPAREPKPRRRLLRPLLLVALVALLLLVAGGVQRGIIPLPPAVASILPFAPAGTQQPTPPTPSGATEATPTTDALQTGAPMSQQMDIVLARQLAAQALERRETRPDLALLLSVEANRLLHADGWQPDRPTHRLAAAEARSSLLTLLQAHPDLMMFLRGHSGIVSSVAFSPDGSLLASGSCAITRTAELATPADAAATAALLPGRTACSGGEIQLWRVAAPAAAQRGAAGHARTSALQHITTLHGHSDGITSLAFSPDSSLLASSSGDNTIIIWDVERGDPVAAPLQGHTEPVTTLAFSPDGSLLGSAGWDETIILWDIASKQPLGQPLRGHTNSINTLTFSPDGSLLASGSWDGSIILWDVANRVPLGEPLQGHAFAVSSVAFSPDGSRLASGGIDAAVVLWDVQSRSSVVVSAPAEQQAAPSDAAGHALPVHRVTFSPDGQLLASADEAGTILLWDIAAGAPAPSPLHRYTLPPLRDYATVETAVAPLMSLAFSPDSRTLASSSGGKAVLLWDVSEHAHVAGGHLRHSLAAPAPTQQQHTCVAFSPDGHTIATGNADTSITLWSGAWNSVSGTLTHTAALSATATPATLQGHANGITSVAFSPDGALLASGSLDDTILVWDLQAAQAVTETQQPPPPAEIAPLDPPLQGHTDGVTDVAFRPDGALLASASLDGSVLLWDTQTWTPREPPLQGHAFAVYRVAFSPDGTLLATGGKDTTVIVWDLATNQPLGAPLEGHTEEVHALAFSPDGSLLASRSSDNVIILWDIESRQGVALPASMPAAQGQQPTTNREGYPAMSLTFSADGRMLASGDSSGNLILWDVATRQPLGSLLQGNANSSSERIAATFNADGTLLAAVRMWQAAGGDAPPAPDAATPPRETLLLWDTSIAAWQQHACRIANRSLTREEWQRFLGEERDYRQTCTAAPPSPGQAP